MSRETKVMQNFQNIKTCKYIEIGRKIPKGVNKDRNIKNIAQTEWLKMLPYTMCSHPQYA